MCLVDRARHGAWRTGLLSALAVLGEDDLKAVLAFAVVVDELLQAVVLVVALVLVRVVDTVNILDLREEEEEGKSGKD